MSEDHQHIWIDKRDTEYDTHEGVRYWRVVTWQGCADPGCNATQNTARSEWRRV